MKNLMKVFHLFKIKQVWKKLIEKLLKSNIKISIPLPNQHTDEIDIIIKTKINKNYKYIN